VRAVAPSRPVVDWCRPWRRGNDRVMVTRNKWSVSHSLVRFEFESGIFFIFLLLFYLKKCLFVRGMQVTGAAWCAATSIMIEVGDLLQMIRDDCTYQLLGGRAIERSGDVLHRVCGDEEHGFFG
jgi:hypothetical protein